MPRRFSRKFSKRAVRDHKFLPRFSILVHSNPLVTCWFKGVEGTENRRAFNRQVAAVCRFAVSATSDDQPRAKLR